MLKDSLLELGLNKTEIEVYLNIVKRGKTSPAEIYQDTGIKRTTVYAVTDELLKKRLIEEDVTGKTKSFIPRSPGSLKNYTEDARKELDRKDKLIEEMLPDLADLADTRKYSIPKIRFIGPDDYKDFLYSIRPAWVESMIETGETTQWGYQGADYFDFKINTDYIDWWWENAPPALDLKLFTDLKPSEVKMVEENNYPRRFTKLWEGDPFPAGLWILGEYVVNLIVSDGEQYIVQIQDNIIAESQRVIFKKLWEEAE